VDRGLRFVEVPESEFESMGANVLAVSPRAQVFSQPPPKSAAIPSRIQTPGSRLVTRIIRLLREAHEFAADDRAYVITMLQQHLTQMEDEQKA
jgi:hypothetical protein